MKKLLAVILAAAFVLSFGICAFADDTPPEPPEGEGTPPAVPAARCNLVDDNNAATITGLDSEGKIPQAGITVTLKEGYEITVTGGTATENSDGTYTVTVDQGSDEVTIKVTKTGDDQNNDQNNDQNKDPVTVTLQDADGKVLYTLKESEYTLDADGKVSLTSEGLAALKDYSNADGEVTLTVTDANGEAEQQTIKIVQFIDDTPSVTVTVQDADGKVLYTLLEGEYMLDADGKVSLTQDGKESLKRFADADGNVTLTVTDADGKITEIPASISDSGSEPIAPPPDTGTDNNTSTTPPAGGPGGADPGAGGGNPGGGPGGSGGGTPPSGSGSSGEPGAKTGENSSVAIACVLAVLALGGACAFVFGKRKA